MRVNNESYIVAPVRATLYQIISCLTTSRLRAVRVLIFDSLPRLYNPDLAVLSNGRSTWNTPVM